MTSFSSLGLSALMLQSLERLKFSDPTPIQAAAIPAALAGKDVLGTAQTGTGKTAAFGLPLVEHIAANARAHTALVITPTRELATQVQRAIDSFIDRRQKIRSALIIGGEPYFKQLRALALNPAIIIGTPGRLNDHLADGKLDLSEVSYLVLDETDRMLDMGFSTQIDTLLAAIPGPRQTLLFSATLPPKIEKLAKTYLHNPERIAVGAESTPAEAVEQRSQFLTQAEKFEALKAIFAQEQGSAVVFVRTKYGTERLAKNLSKAGILAEALHGDLRQRKRDNVIRAFRGKKFRVLVATDVAARGLDIPHIELVVNHDLPQVAEDYIHRIGRTARAGASGVAISFVSPSERDLWAAITRLLNPKGAEAKSNNPKPKPKRRGGGKPWNPMAEGKPKKPNKKKRGAEAGPAAEAKPPREKNRARNHNRDKGKPAWAKEGMPEPSRNRTKKVRSETDTPDRKPSRKADQKPNKKPNKKPGRRRFGDTPTDRLKD